VKNSLLILSLALALSACGSDDKKAATNAVSTDPNAPNIVVPAGAHLSDYDCMERQEFTENGTARVLDLPSKGMNSFWKDSGYSFTLDEESDGSFKSYAKYRKTAIDTVKYRQEIEATLWILSEGKWERIQKNSVRIWEKNGRTRRVLSNLEDGIEKPYHWEIEDTEIDQKTSRSFQRHTNPGVRNRNGLVFSKIEITCTYTDR
jgi:hypothetical protein